MSRVDDYQLAAVWQPGRLADAFQVAPAAVQGLKAELKTLRLSGLLHDRLVGRHHLLAVFRVDVTEGAFSNQRLW